MASFFRFFGILLALAVVRAAEYVVRKRDGTPCIRASFDLGTNFLTQKILLQRFPFTAISLDYLSGSNWINVTLKDLNNGTVEVDSSFCDFPRSSIAIIDFIPKWILRMQFEAECLSNGPASYRLDFVQLDYNLNSSRFPGALNIQDVYSPNYHVNKFRSLFGESFASLADELNLKSASSEVATPIRVKLENISIQAFIGETCPNSTTTTPASPTPKLPSYVVKDVNGSACLRADFRFQLATYDENGILSGQEQLLENFNNGLVSSNSNCSYLEIFDNKAPRWTLGLNFASPADSFRFVDFVWFSLWPINSVPHINGSVHSRQLFAMEKGTSYKCSDTERILLEAKTNDNGSNVFIELKQLRIQVGMLPESEGEFSGHSFECGKKPVYGSTMLIVGCCLAAFVILSIVIAVIGHFRYKTTRL